MCVISNFKTILANNTKERNVTLNSSFLRHCRKEIKTKPACYECRGLFLLIRNIIERFLLYSFSSLLHTEHLHLLVSINWFPTAFYMFHKATKKFTKIRTALFEFCYTDRHHHSPYILLPKVSPRERLSVTCPPFYFTYCTHFVVFPVLWNITFRNLCKFSFTWQGKEGRNI